MESALHVNNEAAKPANALYQTAAATAVVGAALTLVVCVLISANYIQGVLVGARLEKKLEDLRIQLRERPDSEQLVSEIRRLDLQFRRGRIRRLDFSRRGGFLLLGSVVVFLLGVKWAHALRKKLPAPRPMDDPGTEQTRRASFARLALAGSLAATALIVLALAIGRGVDFGIAAETVTPYPSEEEIARNWHRFRGPAGAGISAYTNIPTSWDGKTGQGILWKTEVPLGGNNSPILWEDRIFLSGADPNGHQVYCFDAVTGRLLWERDVGTTRRSDDEPLEVDEDTGLAASTLATDGRRVYAIFPTGDVVCFDFDGNQVWTRSLGVPDTNYGYASSLDVHRNLLLIQYDQAAAEDQKSKLIALNVFSGQPVWERKRPVPNSWTSPIVARIGDDYQIITCAEPLVIAYNPPDGNEIWWANCLSGELAPSPIYAGGLIFVIEPYTKLVAIRPDGRRDVTKTHIAWTWEDGGPDICCPVSNGQLLFMLTTEGLLTCHNVADGKASWEKDYRVYFKASPSLVGDKLYVLSEKGVMFIVQAEAAEYKELGKCELGEMCSASPAFADGRIYIRGAKNLYCIGQLPSKEP
jgi:outer membrane protein assembly factor BamB